MLVLCDLPLFIPILPSSLIDASVTYLIKLNWSLRSGLGRNQSELSKREFGLTMHDNLNFLSISYIYVM